MAINNVYQENGAVILEDIDTDIVKITMQDRVNKNTFSKDLELGLQRAFEAVQQNGCYKVVILTGYDSYFAAGGTKDGLLSLHEGNGKFTDMALYDLPLRCEIPVIAAMQGHGIGGGFVMGLFSDIVILSRESVYTTNFMKYGFTPGFGSTYILKEKLGLSLAQEMLTTANHYRGYELKKRGVPFSVLPKDGVLEHAVELARSLAEKPRVSLVTLKAHMVEEVRSKLQSVIEKEVAMHDKTFHLPEVGERIKVLFGS
ncbi:polyketide synthase [Microbulbifer sp. ZKSA006]|uniref:polyketide synthase n=1 Tax=Microbulbifer sp. ZKSA006 TaxID=3243390 RepID=UPI004039AE79